MAHKPTALVLGGKSGLLGQALMRVLKQHGWKTQALDRKTCDFHNAQAIEQHLERINPSHIFNTIAYTQVDLAEDNPEEALRVNKGVPALLARILKGSTVGLTHYSTDFVFNGKKEKPYTTEDTPEPATVYGATKLAGEIALQESGLSKLCIIRTAWLFGEGKKNFVSTILQKARSSSSISVVHDQTGSPTHTLDLAEASHNLVMAGAEGLFHVVNSGQASWCELAAEAVHLADLSCTVHAIDSASWPQKAKRPAYSVLDTSRYTKTVGKTLQPWPLALRDYVYNLLLDEPNAP